MVRNFYHQILKHTILKGVLGVGEMAQQLASTCCSCREPGFDSQHTQDDSQPPVIPVPGGSGALFWPLWAQGMHVVHRRPWKAKHHTHKLKISLKEGYLRAALFLTNRMNGIKKKHSRDRA